MYEAFLRGVPIFATLTHAEILTIADALQPVRGTVCPLSQQRNKQYLAAVASFQLDSNLLFFVLCYVVAGPLHGGGGGGEGG